MQGKAISGGLRIVPPMAPITADEIAAINERIRQLAATDPRIDYGLAGEVPIRTRALEAVAEGIPNATPEEAAAWLIRALILLQPFPDANHRTALAAAELLLGRAGRKFQPTVDSSREFQRHVSGARYRLLSGFDDAPLTVLDAVDDEVMALCREFVRNATSA